MSTTVFFGMIKCSFKDPVERAYCHSIGENGKRGSRGKY